MGYGDIIVFLLRFENIVCFLVFLVVIWFCGKRFKREEKKVKKEILGIK